MFSHEKVMSLSQQQKASYLRVVLPNLSNSYSLSIGGISNSAMLSSVIFETVLALMYECYTELPY